MASGKLFAKGVGLKEAAEVEAPMVEQLGMLRAWTSQKLGHLVSTGTGEYCNW